MEFKEMREKVLTIPIPEYIYEIVLPNMQEYYNGDYEVNFDLSRYMKCCFHNEDSPSLRWYEETNTYYCFGCGKGGKGPMGTVIGFHINFVEKMNGAKISNKDAIIFLYNYFFEERVIKNVFVPTAVIKKNNNASELAAFNLYRNELEKSIVYDNSISMGGKIDVYDMLDEIDMMLFKDIIDTNEAKEEIERRLISIA